MGNKKQSSAAEITEKELTAYFSDLSASQKNKTAPALQLQLFEDFKAFFPARKNQRDDYKMYRFALELLDGKSGVEAYRLAYNTKTDNVSTQYVAACRLKKHPKVQLILKTLRERAEERALLSTTELYAGISHLALNGAKEELRLAAYREVAKIRGVYSQPDGVVADTLVLNVIRPGARKKEGHV